MKHYRSLQRWSKPKMWYLLEMKLMSVSKRTSITCLKVPLSSFYLCLPFIFGFSWMFRSNCMLLLWPLHWLQKWTQTRSAMLLSSIVLHTIFDFSNNTSATFCTETQPKLLESALMELRHIRRLISSTKVRRSIRKQRQLNNPKLSRFISDFCWDDSISCRVELCYKTLLCWYTVKPS